MNPDAQLKNTFSPLGVGSFIIPAIDIIDGKCVRLAKGDYSTKRIYNDSPLDIAKQFEDAGLKRLHLVDLDGAKKGSVVNWKTLQTIASKTNLVIDFSGGLSTTENIIKAFDFGATLVSIGTIAIKNESLLTEWINLFGATKFIIGADVKNECIQIRGWTEHSVVTVFELIENYLLKGIENYFCTDIAKDGLLEGPALNLYKKIIAKYPKINLIASGGVSCLEDLEALQALGCSAAIVGKAFYENKISLHDLKKAGTKS